MCRPKRAGGGRAERGEREPEPREFEFAGADAGAWRYQLEWGT